MRYTWGSLPTTYNFTGQRLDGDTGLLDYGARYYDPYLNRWIQPDTIVPDPHNPQSLNRFSYTLNNPVRYTDPTGHRVCGDDPETCEPGERARYNIIFRILPVSEEDLEWIQWYGATEYAYVKRNSDLYAYSQRLHGGLDLGADAGTPVRAGVAGEIVKITYEPGVCAPECRTGFRPANVTVRVGGYDIIYGHLEEGSLGDLGVGDTVYPDTQLGTVSNEEGHLHLEIRDAGEPYPGNLHNPLDFMAVSLWSVDR